MAELTDTSLASVLDISQSEVSACGILASETGISSGGSSGTGIASD